MDSGYISELVSSFTGLIIRLCIISFFIGAGLFWAGSCLYSYIVTHTINIEIKENGTPQTDKESKP